MTTARSLVGMLVLSAIGLGCGEPTPAAPVASVQATSAEPVGPEPGVDDEAPGPEPTEQRAPVEPEKTDAEPPEPEPQELEPQELQPTEPDPPNAVDVAVGDKVKAPFGAKTRKTGARVKEVYGKLAHLKFSRGDIGWALLHEMDPPRKAHVLPPGDTCEFGNGESVDVGDKVRAKWSRRNIWYGATVTDIYGKLAHLKYVDGDEDWWPCSQMKPRKATTKAPKTRSRNGAKAAASKCRSGCNRKCKGADNTSKCVGACRRACG